MSRNIDSYNRQAIAAGDAVLGVEGLLATETRLFTLGGVAGYDDADIINLAYPVGSTYTQYATVDSDVANTAMPATRAPTALFGGTWALMYDDEGIDFHTEGYDTVVHGRGQARQATGIARDEMQLLTGSAQSTATTNLLRSSAAAVEGALGVGGAGTALTNRHDQSASTDGRALVFNSSSSPNAKTSDATTGRTTDRNRWMRLWVRTA